MAAKTDFVFLINSLTIVLVFDFELVPDALINSSIDKGLPAEYNADSILAMISSFGRELLNFACPSFWWLVYFVHELTCL